MRDTVPSHSLVERLLRAADQLPHTRFEIFRRLYVQGESVHRVREDLGLDEQQLERERSAMLRSLMRMS